MEKRTKEEKAILKLLRANFDPSYNHGVLYGKGEKEIKCEVVAALIAMKYLVKGESKR